MAIKILGTTVIDNSRNITGVRVRSGNVFQIPSGNTSSRPVSPTTGTVRFNSEENVFELYDGSSWVLVTTVAS
jgi:hypothetical protein